MPTVQEKSQVLDMDKNSRIEYYHEGKRHTAAASMRYGAFEVVVEQDGKEIARKVFGTATPQETVVRMMESMDGYEMIVEEEATNGIR